MTHPSTPMIAAFWEWFASVCGSFGPGVENRHLIEELDRRVSSLGPFSWEIGPAAQHGISALTIGPGGDPELLSATRAIVKLAPTCPGWTFHPAKPRKQLVKRLYVVGSHEVDATQWHYSLVRYKDGYFGATLYAPTVEFLPLEARADVATLVLDGELGEEARLSYIADVEVRARCPQPGEKATSIEHLAAHLAQLTPKH